MVFIVFLLFSFRLVSLPTTLASLPLRVMLLNRSTALKDSATDIEKTSLKGALERERPNSSKIKIRGNRTKIFRHSVRKMRFRTLKNFVFRPFCVKKYHTGLD